MRAMQVADGADTRAKRETKPCIRGLDDDGINAWFEVDAVLRRNPGMDEPTACKRAGVTLKAYLEAKRLAVATTGEAFACETVTGAYHPRKAAARHVSEENVREIRRRVAAGERYRAIAADMNCSLMTVRAIGLRHSRKDVV